MLDQHYRPRTPLVLREEAFPAAELQATTAAADVARICLRRPPHDAPHVFWLSETGDPGEAARRLFALLRELDEAGYARIECERVPERGLGVAINDRLRRAATTR
jgi:L-threonylcarbamoyladenylate synthase